MVVTKMITTRKYGRKTSWLLRREDRWWRRNWKVQCHLLCHRFCIIIKIIIYVKIIIIIIVIINAIMSMRGDGAGRFYFHDFSHQHLCHRPRCHRNNNCQHPRWSKSSDLLSAFFWVQVKSRRHQCHVRKTAFARNPWEPGNNGIVLIFKDE